MDRLQRYGMVTRLRPERRDDYLRLHAAVWPSVERMLREANIRNFTIFLHGDLLFGYYEYTGEDHDADQARIAADPESQRWWALTDPCQESPTDPGSAVRWEPMHEVWHLTPDAAVPRPGDEPPLPR
ncbi:L-rhamnose mutarotase [Saccharothrix sp. NRRL B-16348]|uniref:L-rhamnose mutarotase n=1 Tax=Saccharothrix sp. NRRL B-16348 TaxID=1415542 RepID=UPI000B0C9C19|nr:L-rhamnose mutarotase [Saccharothrix sp. NRRL B-16348]